MSDAWIPVVSVIAGGVLGVAGTFFTTWHTTRADMRRDQTAHQRELARVRREAFTKYLNASLNLFNSITLLAKRFKQENKVIEMEDINALPEYHCWSEASTPLYVLLDDRGANVLDRFEQELFREATRAGRGDAANDWFAQIGPLLAEMRRLL